MELTFHASWWCALQGGYIVHICFVSLSRQIFRG